MLALKVSSEKEFRRDLRYLPMAEVSLEAKEEAYHLPPFLVR